MKIGVDIIEIKRIRQAVERFGNRFLERIYTPRERDFCRARKDPIPCLAARFAVKEAFMKAIGTGVSKGVVFKDIEIYRRQGEAPKVVLYGEAKKINNNRKVEVSITHSKDYALGVCLVSDGTD